VVTEPAGQGEGEVGIFLRSTPLARSARMAWVTFAGDEGLDHGAAGHAEGSEATEPSLIPPSSRTL